MGEDHVGLAAGDGLVKGVAEVLPQAVENDAVEAVAVGKEPRMRSGGGTELVVDRAEGVDGEALFAEAGGVGGVEGEDLALAIDLRSRWRRCGGRCWRGRRPWG